MKNRAILFAAAAVAVFALGTVANAQMVEAGAKASLASNASQTSRASHTVLDSQNIRSASFSAGRPTLAGAATKTRCVKAVSGRVEDTVCMTTNITADEAMYYFERANNEGHDSKK